MKKILCVFALIMSAQAFAGGSDVDSSNGNKFPFGGNNPSPLGYMIITGKNECQIIQGKGLYAGSKNAQRAPQDLLKAITISDSRGGLGLLLTMSAGNQTQTVGLMGELAVSQGNEFNYKYQAPDQFHHYNKVNYKVVVSEDNTSAKIDIIMLTAEGAKGTAQVECSLR